MADTQSESVHAQITYREQKDFKISKFNQIRRTGSAAGISSRLSRRSLHGLADASPDIMGAENQRIVNHEISDRDVGSARNIQNLQNLQSKRSELDPSAVPTEEFNNALADSFG
jgi:hypothetical protein